MLWQGGQRDWDTSQDIRQQDDASSGRGRAGQDRARHGQSRWPLAAQLDGWAKDTPRVDALAARQNVASARPSLSLILSLSRAMSVFM